MGCLWTLLARYQIDRCSLGSLKKRGGGAHLCHVTKTTAVWTERATREELRQVGYRYFNRIHVLNSRLYKVVCILNIF